MHFTLAAPLSSSFLPQIALCLCLVYIFWLIQRRLAVRYAFRNIPGPTSSSLIWGEEWNLYSTEPGSLYVDWHQRYGKVVKFTGAFGHQVLSITDARAMSFILGEGAYKFPKPDGVRAWFRTLLGEGILWVEGKEAHEKQRRTVGTALSQQSVRNLTPMFYENAAKMAAQWTNLLDAQHVDEMEIEVTSWAGRYALDIIGRAAFSYDFDCLSGKPHPIAETLDGLTNHENTLSSFYMRALFWLFPSILSIGKKGEMIRRTRKELGELATNILRDAKIAGDSNGKTFMSLMLRNEKASADCIMDEEQIAAQMRTIISAGYEPVSSAIPWLLYELARHPHFQHAIREELSAAREPSLDELNSSYPFLDAFVREVLRMHPPVLENHHVASETINLLLSEPLLGTADLHVTVPKGTIIVMPVNVVQKDRSMWGPDADVFRPERWLARNINDRRDLFAFSLGPRGCLGRSFAITEIKVLVITLIHHFAFSCPHDIEAFQSFVIRPRVVGEGSTDIHGNEAELSKSL